MGSWPESRQDHRARQAEDIAAAALSLLVEGGASALTMAALATAAGISRPTLYRYYRDVDAVLLGVAELVASHDEAFGAQVADLDDPAAQLDHIVTSIARAGNHGRDLGAALPRLARERIAQHEASVEGLLVDVLEAGVGAGMFRHDIRPDADAPLILGLATAAGPDGTDRAVDLVHRLVDRHPRRESP
jgi:AcrR family transcriptional regulator